MRLRLSEPEWSAFADALCERTDVESAGVLLAEVRGEVLVARHLRVVPEDGYLIRRRDQLRIDPVALNRLVRPARDEGLAILTVHTHPRTLKPWFSLADDAGDARLMPSFFAQTPGPHGSIVLAGETRAACGRIWSQCDSVPASLAVGVVGRTVRGGDAPPAPEGAWFDRQVLALGEHGHRILRDLHVGIVGLGGTGSAVLVQLAHLGVGKLTLVDGDRVEASNVSRVLGARAADVGNAKVDVASRYVRALGLGCSVTTACGHLGGDVGVEMLACCDVVVSCVDRHSPRAILNRMAYHELVPVVDLGTAFRVNATGSITAGAGRVVVVGPGRPCLACWGHVDPDRLRIEAMTPEERAERIAEGYFSGADVPQPSVVAFNTSVAGAAVVEILRLVTGFAGAADPPDRLAFDFVTGEVRRNALAPTSCRICAG
ncbi:MAG: ThiF family adenylyltransferase [Myxococcales bacterium]|nr:ThiF family adenylyltransferase [Myxococcales bacterium]